VNTVSRKLLKAAGCHLRVPYEELSKGSGSISREIEQQASQQEAERIGRNRFGASIGRPTNQPFCANHSDGM
jgi:hypothetical protein